jgi:hypothetical protein
VIRNLATQGATSCNEPCCVCCWPWRYSWPGSLLRGLRRSRRSPWRSSIEKQAAARGIGDLKINWAKMAGPSVMVDAIISGNLHFSAQGVPSLALMWDRTKGGVGVKAISAVTNTDIYLNTRNPNIKSIRDFTDKDRIALPSVKVSTQALFLQIASEKEWVPGSTASSIT